MPSSAQYTALTRLLNHNTRVHEMEELLLRLPVTEDMICDDDALWDMDSLSIDYEHFSNPIADLQEDMDKEVRASLVACWFAMPMELDDLHGV